MNRINTEVPWWNFSFFFAIFFLSFSCLIFFRLFNFSPQQIISFVFISGICVKYIFFDSVSDANSTTPASQSKVAAAPLDQQSSRPGTEPVVTVTGPAPSAQNIMAESLPVRTRRFTVGDEQEEEDDVKASMPPCMLDREVQTDDECEVKRKDVATPALKRSLDTCVSLLKSKVCGALRGFFQKWKHKCSQSGIKFEKIRKMIREKSKIRKNSKNDQKKIKNQKLNRKMIFKKSKIQKKIETWF